MTTGKRQIEARGGMWPRGEDLIRQPFGLPPSPAGEGFWRTGYSYCLFPIPYCLFPNP